MLKLTKFKDVFTWDDGVEVREKTKKIGEIDRKTSYPEHPQVYLSPPPV